MIPRHFVLFLVAGGIAALANIASRIGFDMVMSYVPAIVLAYGVGMVTAFVLNRLLVFKSPARGLHHQVFWFVMVNAAAVAQTILISLLLARWLFPAIALHYHPETIAHVIGVVVPVFTSYLGHKYLTFRTT